MQIIGQAEKAEDHNSGPAIEESWQLQLEINFSVNFSVRTCGLKSFQEITAEKCIWKAFRIHFL